jgi:alkanesulfonate monooxygenase SsuD/methylene tetrahydromethanopterin reductase-like flavin-dependent oxidoreductase (luciferase family)
VRCVYNVPVRIDARSAPIDGHLVGSPTDVVERLGEFVALGFSGFNLMPTGDDPARQTRLLADDVLPALRS